MLGVHSTKFDNEKGLGAIYNGVHWYDVSHVMNVPLSLSCSCELGDVCGMHYFLWFISSFFVSSCAWQLEGLIHCTHEFRIMIHQWGMMLRHPLLNQEMVSFVGCSNNKDMTMWWQLGIHLWPTITLLNPKGKPITMFYGGGHY